MYNTEVPIVPHSWRHVCVGLDSVSGLLRIVINGILIDNEQKEYFNNTASMRPKSIARKFVGKYFRFTFKMST